MISVMTPTKHYNALLSRNHVLYSKNSFTTRIRTLLTKINRLLTLVENAFKEFEKKNTSTINGVNLTKWSVSFDESVLQCMIRYYGGWRGGGFSNAHALAWLRLFWCALQATLISLMWSTSVHIGILIFAFLAFNVWLKLMYHNITDFSLL